MDWREGTWLLPMRPSREPGLGGLGVHEQQSLWTQGEWEAQPRLGLDLQPQPGLARCPSCFMVIIGPLGLLVPQRREGRSGAATKGGFRPEPKIQP